MPGCGHPPSRRQWRNLEVSLRMIAGDVRASAGGVEYMVDTVLYYPDILYRSRQNSSLSLPLCSQCRDTHCTEGSLGTTFGVDLVDISVES